MRAFPLLGERPALAVADRRNQVLIGFVEVHLTDFDQDKPSRCAGKENEPEIDGDRHGARPASLRTAASLKPARFQARSKLA